MEEDLVGQADVSSSLPPVSDEDVRHHFRSMSTLSSFLSRSLQSPNLRLSFLLSYFRLFFSGQVSPNPQIVCLISRALLPSFSRNFLPLVVESLLSLLGEAPIIDPDLAVPLDLLPVCLHSLISAPSLTVSGSDDPISGTEYVDSALDRILQLEWSPAVLTRITNLLREFPLGDQKNSRSSEFLRKVFCSMEGVDAQDVPSLVYQLLVLASKGFDRKAVAEGIFAFFRTVKAWTPSVKRQVEGTVLLHLNFAVKQDPMLGLQMTTSLRSLGGISSFGVSVLFSIARIRRFNEGAMKVVRMAVVNSHRDYRFARESKWLPNNVKEEYKKTVHTVEQSILSVTRESNCGREHITPSIVQFGFILLELSHDRFEGEDDGFMGAEELGIQSLNTLFEVHDMARNEVVEQCKFRVLSLKTQQSGPVIKLLSCLIRNHPFPMLEHVAHLKELLDYFTFMHSKTALTLLLGILPLIKLSHDLQRYIILVVRKAMFKRELKVRIAASNAVIHLILSEQRSGDVANDSLPEISSQASCSQQTENCVKGATLFQEFRGILRRCLSQQAPVKQILYQGLLKLVLVDSSLYGLVLEFLLPHLLKFIASQENSDFHLSLDDCVKVESGKPYLDEPFDCLLSCAYWLLFHQSTDKTKQSLDQPWSCFGFSLSQDNEPGRISSVEAFTNVIYRMRKYFRHVRVEDVLSKHGDENDPSMEGQKASYHAFILLGILKVLVNSVASDLEKASDMGVIEFKKELYDFISLHDSIEKVYFSKLENVWKRGILTASCDILSVPNHEGKETPYADLLKITQSRIPFMSTSSIKRLFMIVVQNTEGSHSSCTVSSQNRSQASQIALSAKLISFLLKACLLQLKTYTSISAEDPLKALIYGDIMVLGLPLLQLIWLLASHVNIHKAQKKKEKWKRTDEEERTALHRALTCFGELLHITLSGEFHVLDMLNEMVSAYKHRISSEEAQWTKENEFSQPHLPVGDQRAMTMHLFLKTVLRPLFHEMLALAQFRECEVLGNITLMLGDKLSCTLVNSTGAWADHLCRSTNIGHGGTACILATLAINLSSSPNDISIACSMASELVKIIGTEESLPVNQSETYPVVNCNTRTEITGCLLHAMDKYVTNLEWATWKLTSLSGETPLKYEEKLYARSEAVVQMASHFAEMNLKDPQAERFLSLSVRIYKLLARMAKSCIAPKGHRQAIPSLKFQALVEFTCRKLTCCLYNFMTTIQRDQQELSKKGVANKIRRETKCIPDLIFQIEDYEKHLIKLGKLTKVNLMRHAKRSITRDFKIVDVKSMGSEASHHKSSQHSHSASQDGSGVESEKGEEEDEQEAYGNGCPKSPDSANDKEEECCGEEHVVLRTKRRAKRTIFNDSEDKEDI